jgi:hypothetical protein
LKTPRTAEVTVTLPGFRMPRIAMHRHAQVLRLHDDDATRGFQPALLASRPSPLISRSLAVDHRER